MVIRNQMTVHDARIQILRDVKCRSHLKNRKFE